MKNIIYVTLLMLVASCAGEKYHINGKTSLADFEGKTIFLKVYSNEDLVNIDSAVVKDGGFVLSGRLDSTIFANLFIEDRSLMPVVIESGEINIELNAIQSKLSGTPLNDSLYNFLQEKSKLDALFSELPRRESQMIMEGLDHDEIVTALNQQAQSIAALSERHMTNFIKANDKNVLGTGVFMLMTSAYPYPIFTSSVEEIIIGAPESFRADAYVADYIRMARENANADEEAHKKSEDAPAE